jgi:hypothetical protein
MAIVFDVLEDLKRAHQVITMSAGRCNVTQHLATPDLMKARDGNPSRLLVRLDTHIFIASGQPRAERTFSCADLHHSPRTGHIEGAPNRSEP